LRSGFIRNPFVSMMVAADKHDHPGLIRSSLLLHIVLTVVIVLLLCLSAEPLSVFWSAHGLAQLLYVYGVTSLVFVVFFHFEYLLHARMAFKEIFIINFLRLALPFVYILGYFILGKAPSLIELAIAQLCATLFAAMAAYRFQQTNDLEVTSGWLNTTMFKRLFQMGKYTLGTNVSSMLIKNTDSWMIGRLISTSGVALYTPAIRISNIVEVPTIAVANVIFPQVGTSMKESGLQGIQKLYYKSVSLILAVMLPLVLPVYFFADTIILLLFGEEYLQAIPILQITVFYTLLVPFSRQFGVFMDALQMPKLNFYLSLFVAIANVILNYILIKTIGLVGAAYSILLLYGIIFIITQATLYYKLNINTWIVIKEWVRWYYVGGQYLGALIRKGKEGDVY
jgi:O-antigen/teichoic acid export membrane protein